MKTKAKPQTKYKKNVQKIIKPDKPIVFVDNRELSSPVATHLGEYDILIKPIQLNVGDYIASDKVCIERKTISDFLQSIINQRIFKQAENLVNSYETPLLIMEGNPEMLFTERNIHENVIRGVLSSIAVDYHIPIIWTQDAKETAAQIFWIANREQVLEKKEPQIRATMKIPTISKKQEFLIAGLPNISNTLGRRLLKHFKTPRHLFQASLEDLLEVEGIGKEKAKKIREILETCYKDSH